MQIAAADTKDVAQPAHRCRENRRRRGPGFMEKHQPARVERLLQFRPGSASLFYILAVLLGGPEVLFLSVKPNRVTTFQITA